MKIAVIVISLIVIIALAFPFLRPETHVTIGGVEYSLDTTRLDLSGGPVPYVRELTQLTQLRELDLRGTGLTPEDYEYVSHYLPYCKVLWDVPFQGQYYPQDTRALTVTELSEADVDILKYFPHLELLDGMACPEARNLVTAQSQYPRCTVKFRVWLEGQYVPWDARELILSETDLETLNMVLTVLQQVEKVTLTQPFEDTGKISVFRSLWPELETHYSFHVFDRVISTDDTYLDLSGIEMADTSLLESILPHMAGLERVDMIDCGIADDLMADMAQRWPDTKFVWEVRIGPIRIRTDATYFMPYQYDYVISDRDAGQLKYLTDLICLDFGHMDITRTDYLAYMPKLQYLLLGDTAVSDLGPCANLKELKYAELFMTDVTDFTPLLECPNLVDLNVSYTYPEDPTILVKMPQLENLWFLGLQNADAQAALKAALPDTTIVFGSGSSTDYGWRELPNYFAQRDILGMKYMKG